MRKLLRVSVLGLLVCGALSFGLPARAYDARYTNPETGYDIVIEDDADLLTDSEENLLIEKMKPVTAYGNAAFTSTNVNSFSSSIKYAGDFCYRHFGYRSSTVFLIDMDRRQLTIASDGDIYKTITTGVANTIVDNCYRYASNGLYYRCAEEVFGQITSVLEGRRIAQPMRYASNVLIALLAGMIINFVVISRKARLRAAKYSELLSASKNNYFRFAEPRAHFIRTTRTYSPQSHGSSGGGGGGFSGGGGGGGGGFSGGGGSHGF